MVVAPGSEGLSDVIEAFGREMLDERGELDRKKMGKLVFATPEKRRALEAILHPRIRERYEQVLDALEKAGHPVMVYEVPLLFEKKLHLQDEMKGVILVVSSADSRIARVKDRDALTTEEVLARMRAQMPEEEKRHLADYIVVNDGDLDDLRREVEYLISRFLKLPTRDERAQDEAEAALLDVLPVDSVPAPVHDDRTAELDVHPPARFAASAKRSEASTDTVRGPAPKRPEADDIDEAEDLEEVDEVDDVEEVDENGDSLEVDLHDPPHAAAPVAAPLPGSRRATVPMFSRSAPEAPTDDPDKQSQAEKGEPLA